MAKRVDKSEATSQSRMNPIVALMMLLILLITTGSLKKARKFMGLISKEFVEDVSSPREKIESFKIVSKEDLNDILYSKIKGELKTLNHTGKQLKTVKVKLEPGDVAINKLPLSNSKSLDLKEALTVKPTSKVSSEARNLDDTLMSYIKVKKCRISISECSRDLGIPPSEVKRTLVRLHELGRIRLQWSLKRSVEPNQVQHLLPAKNT